MRIGWDGTIEAVWASNVWIRTHHDALLSGWNNNSPNVRWMWLEALNRTVAANVIKDAWRVLVSRYQQSTRRIHAHSSHGRSLSGIWAGRWCHHIYTTTRSQIPESNWFVLRSRHEHCTAPIVKRQDVTAMTAECLVRRWSCAVGDVNLAIARATADQKAGFVRAVLEEAKVANCSVVHCEFDLES